jgi:hypothetical protein
LLCLKLNWDFRDPSQGDIGEVMEMLRPGYVDLSRMFDRLSVDKTQNAALWKDCLGTLIG